MGTDIAAALESDPVLAHEADIAQQESDIEKQVVDTVNKEEMKSDGKLILARRNSRRSDNLEGPQALLRWSWR